MNIELGIIHEDENTVDNNVFRDIVEVCANILSITDITFNYILLDFDKDFNNLCYFFVRILSE